MLEHLQGLDAEEANRLFDLLLLDQNRPAFTRKHRDRALLALGIRHVRVTLRTPADPSNRTAPMQASGPADLHRYQDLAASLHQNHALAARDQLLSVDTAATALGSMAWMRSYSATSWSHSSSNNAWSQRPTDPWGSRRLLLRASCSS